MESISLKEASELVGKDQSTIRKIFQKPDYKLFTSTVRGKIYIDKGKLLEVYPTENGQGRQNSEPLGSRQGMPRHAELQPEKGDEQKAAIETAMQALVSQLEAKDRQIDSLHQRIFEANSNHSRLLQQNSLQQPVEQTPPIQEEKGISKKSKTWKVVAIVMLVVMVICIIAFAIALGNGWRFMR